MADKAQIAAAAQAFEDVKKLVAEQADRVKTLKAQPVDAARKSEHAAQVKEEVVKLQQLKAKLAEAEQEYKILVSDKPQILVRNKSQLDGLIARRFFYTPAFSIYGGVAGLYDYGPPGCAIKANLINFWRQHFVIEEGMLEIEGPALTPETVLRTSGHVDKFKDVMVSDAAKQEAYRADHLVEDHIDKLLETPGLTEARRQELRILRASVGGFSAKEMTETIRTLELKSPHGNELSEAYDFNLMFGTSIGPGSRTPGYLRPELAQGIFVNFKRLLEFNNGRMPFAGAQIGQAYRNEIAPRNGLLRVREFTLAEIEHFCNPDSKDHPKFGSVSSISMQLLSAKAQETGGDIVVKTVGEAVGEGLINNQTLGYFMARTYLFLTAVGIKPQWLRFRQHKSNEMAHYAKDCWDAEIQTSCGWIECVGHADRACYDLGRHGEFTKTDMSAFEEFDQPREITVVVRKLNKSLIGKTFARKGSNLQQQVTRALEKGLSDDECLRIEAALRADGKYELSVMADDIQQTVQLVREMVTFSEAKNRVSGRPFVPSVVEPSFGLGRIIYCLLEHSFYVREGSDEQAQGADVVRAVLSLPPVIAPYKCSVLTIQVENEFEPIMAEIARLLSAQGVSHKLDSSGASLGRRYARTDEVGIPLGITIDYLTTDETEPDTFRTVTLRERDTTTQIFGKIEDICTCVGAIVNGTMTWKEAYDKFPHVENKEQRQSKKKLNA